MKEYSIEKDAGQGNTVTPPGLSQTSRRAGDTESYLSWHRSQVPGSELVVGLKSRRGKKTVNHFAGVQSFPAAWLCSA